MRVIGGPVLRYFFVVWDPGVLLNGVQGHCHDMSIRPLSEPMEGRSWCIWVDVMDTSERLAVTMVIERWNGRSSPHGTRS